MSNTTMTDEQIKSAMLDLFIKSAEAEGIDLEKLSQADINVMYANWEDAFVKAAEEDEGKKDEPSDEEKKEKAKAEHEEKKASISKIAEADDLGRQMARSFLDELDKVAAEKQAGPRLDGAKKAITEGVAKAKAHVTGALNKGKEKALSTRGGELLSGSKRDAIGKKKDALSATLGRAMDSGDQETAHAVAHNLRGHAAAHKSEARKVLGARIGAGAATAGAAGAGGYAMSKKSSVGDFDALAAELAVEKAAAAGFDAEECGEKIAALITLGGLEESEKVASIQDTEAALHHRASEYLEAAGYPVNWG